MTADNPIHFAEILASRLCHDVISPIGAISTGLELFQEVVPPLSVESQEIFDLIFESAKAATLRASMFRAVFSGGGSALPLKEARLLLEKYFESTKLTLHWESSCPTEAPFKGWSRLLMNAILCISDCAPRGGELHVTMPDNMFFSLHLKADPIILHHETSEVLDGKCTVQDLTPRNALYHFLYYLMQENGAEGSVQHQTASSELIFAISSSPNHHLQPKEAL